MKFNHVELNTWRLEYRGYNVLMKCEYPGCWRVRADKWAAGQADPSFIEKINIGGAVNSKWVDKACFQMMAAIDYQWRQVKIGLTSIHATEPPTKERIKGEFQREVVKLKKQLQDLVDVLGGIDLNKHDTSLADLTRMQGSYEMIRGMRNHILGAAHKDDPRAKWHIDEGHELPIEETGVRKTKDIIPELCDKVREFNYDAPCFQDGSLVRMAYDIQDRLQAEGHPKESDEMRIVFESLITIKVQQEPPDPSERPVPPPDKKLMASKLKRARRILLKFKCGAYQYVCHDEPEEPYELEVRDDNGN